MFPSILLSTLLTLTPVWTSREMSISFAYMGQGYEYVFELSADREFSNIYISTPPSSNSFSHITIYDTNKYYQRVKYYIVGSDIINYQYLGQFYINLERGYLGEDIPYFPPEEELPPEQEEEEISDAPVIDIPIPEDTHIPPIPPPLIQERFVLPDIVDYRENLSPIQASSSVLGVSTQQSNTCKISLIRKESTEVKSWDCDIGIQISKVTYLDWEEYLSLEISGVYPQYIYTDIQVYECRKFSLFEPKTWFGCKEVLIDSFKEDIKLTYFGNIYLDGISQKSTNFSFMNTSFYLSNKFKEDISKKKVHIYLNVYSQVKGKEWIDIQYTIKKDVTIPSLEKAAITKPFSFPIDRLIGVTQWHGCTQYQCPHKGIDFGARLNKVISVGDGKVVNVGYDKYGGECNQGGNFVIVKHSNGMYSTYFHLDSYSVTVGSKVTKGSVIGISGNTGKKNCQPLGYHLHFETRAGLSSSTHVNPVEYVAIDWNSIPTISYKQFPKRLTGDNPHPNF